MMMSGTAYDNWKTDDGYEEWPESLLERAAELYMETNHYDVVELIQKHVKLDDICQEIQEEDEYAE